MTFILVKDVKIRSPTLQQLRCIRPFASPDIGIFVARERTLPFHLNNNTNVMS